MLLFFLVVLVTATKATTPHTHGELSIDATTRRTRETQRALETFDVLQSVYWSEDMGLWKSSMWWQNANTVTSLANLGLKLQNETVSEQIVAILERVFEATDNLTIGNCDKGVNLTLSGYFDDEEWWGLAWLKAYQLSNKDHFLNRSVLIFGDLVARAWKTDSCGGGVCWQSVNCYKNAITNELFLSHAAQLALVVKTGPFRDWAIKAWKWLGAAEMISNKGLFNDGVDTFDKHPSVCLNNGQQAWTYNQGVILSGLAHLWELEKDDHLLSQAVGIIDATFKHLTHNGTNVLKESCEPSEFPVVNLYNVGCSGDGLMFKGVFIRHLQYFLDVVAANPENKVVSEEQQQKYRAAIGENADTIWTHAACLPPQLSPGVGDSLVLPALFGGQWKGPCGWALGGPSATSQTAALDVFVAALS